MPEYLRIKINKEDFLAKEWSGSAGVNEIIVDPSYVSGDEYGTEVSGAILAETDYFGNVFFHTDIPEPFKLRGEENLKDRIKNFEVENFDDLESKLSAEVKNKARQEVEQEILNEVNAEYDKAVQDFARVYMMSGARNLDEYHGRTKEADFGLTLDSQQTIVDEIDNYDRLMSRRRAVGQEIDRRLRSDDRYVDMDVSRLEDERRGIIYDMQQLDDKYHILETREDKSRAKEKHTEFEVHNLPGVSRDDFEQVKSDFGPVDEDHFDEFMDELSLLQDEGLNLGRPKRVSQSPMFKEKFGNEYTNLTEAILDTEYPRIELNGKRLVDAQNDTGTEVSLAWNKDEVSIELAQQIEQEISNHGLVVEATNSEELHHGVGLGVSDYKALVLGFDLKQELGEFNQSNNLEQ